ncbi:MAG: very short patch repair endonuclease [Nitrospinaceae bacterium]
MDNLTPEQRSKTMARVRSKDTKPEMQIRRMLHKMGYRYRLHRKDLPGKPDLVFPSRNKVIFIHGCFWHSHKCPSGEKIPRTNTNYWVSKLAGNRERDRGNQIALKKSGRRILVVWECQLKKENHIREKIRKFLGNPK